MTGTTPDGTATERQAAQWVRAMFGRVAHRYDLANHLLSLNIDQGWRRHTVESVRDILRRPETRAVDLCCGTGDLSLALARNAAGRVFGSDFCRPMLQIASEKVDAAKLAAPVLLFEADAMELPLPDSSIDLITCAFGFRNLANYDRGLREFRRVLRKGGAAAILEFSHPPNPLIAVAYRLYAKHWLPRVGGLLSGFPEAYSYLPESIAKFPAAPALAERMRAAGFSTVSFDLLTFGIVALHIARI